MRLVSRMVVATLPPRVILPLFARRQRRRGERELRMLPGLVDPSRPSVDAGANLGVYSYWLSRLTPKVHAFEPHPEMVQFLRKAKLKNVLIHHVALSDHRGTATLSVPRHGSGPSPGHSTLQRSDNPTDVRFSVETCRLDEAIGDEDIGFIKIDVEGHELAVLAGASRVISRSRPVLLVEIEQQNYPDRSVHTVIAEIRKLGYDAFYAAGTALRPAEEAPVKARWEPGEGHTSNFIFKPSR